MKRNIGPIDQAARIVIGLALVLLALGDYIGVWGYIGIVPLATGLFDYCPLYHALGFTTRHDKPATP